jgi:hypothetical protein
MADMEWIVPEGYDFDNGSSLYWIICYPRGDKSKLAVAEMCDGTSYEEADYRLASHKRFRDEQEANDYCRELARKNGLLAETTDHDFLD